jgi:transcription elongation factor Elf1
MAPTKTAATAPAVAKETLAYCTSCKIDLAHLVVSMKGDKIAKVECKTCKKTHGFKAPKGVTEVAPKKKRASKKTEDGAPSASTIEAEWEKLMASHREAPFKGYSAKGKFLLGDKIKHPTFGDGIVGKLIYPNKLEVIFRTDIKVLIHGGA